MEGLKMRLMHNVTLSAGCSHMVALQMHSSHRSVDRARLVHLLLLRLYAHQAACSLGTVLLQVCGLIESRLCKFLRRELTVSAFRQLKLTTLLSHHAESQLTQLFKRLFQRQYQWSGEACVSNKAQRSGLGTLRAICSPQPTGGKD